MSASSAGPYGVRLLGFASSKNTTDIAAEQVSTVVNAIKSVCSATSSNSISANIDWSTADQAIQRIEDVDQRSQVDLDCVQDAMMDNTVQQETTQRAIQKAKSSVSGISFGSFASAINKARVQAKNVSAIINETMQKCVASNKVEVIAYIGVHNPTPSVRDTMTLQEIRNIKMDSATIAECTQTASQMNHVRQTVDQTVDQTATATVTGLNLFALLALIFLAFMVMGGGGAYAASRATGSRNGVFSILWLSAAALCGGLGAVAMAQAAEDDPYRALEATIEADAQREFPSGTVGGKFIVSPFMRDAIRLSPNTGKGFAVVDVSEEGVAPPGVAVPTGFVPTLDDFPLANNANDPTTFLPEDNAPRRGQWWATTKLMEAAAAADGQTLTPSYMMSFVRRHAAARRAANKPVLITAFEMRHYTTETRGRNSNHVLVPLPRPAVRLLRATGTDTDVESMLTSASSVESAMDKIGLYKPFTVYSGDRDIYEDGTGGFARPARGGKDTPACKNDTEHIPLYPYYTYPPLVNNRFRGNDGDVYVYSTTPSGGDADGYPAGTKPAKDGWCGDGRIAARVWRGGVNGQWGPPTTILTLSKDNSHAAGFHAYGPLGYEIRRIDECPALTRTRLKGCTRQPVGGCSKSSQGGQGDPRPGECVRYHIFVNENKTLTVWTPIPDGPDQPSWTDTETMAYEMMPRNFPGRGSLVLDIEAGSNLQWGSAIEGHNFLAVVIEDSAVRARLEATITQREPPATLGQQADDIVNNYQHYIFFFLAGIFGLLGLYYGFRAAAGAWNRRRRGGPSSEGKPEGKEPEAPEGEESTTPVQNPYGVGEYSINNSNNR